MNEITMAGFESFAEIPNVWITGNNTDTGAWHLGRWYAVRGEKTGRVLSHSYVTACQGRSLGSAWGSSRCTAPRSEFPEGNVCKRCKTIAIKLAAGIL